MRPPDVPPRALPPARLPQNRPDRDPPPAPSLSPWLLAISFYVRSSRLHLPPPPPRDTAPGRGGLGIQPGDPPSSREIFPTLPSSASRSSAPTRLESETHRLPPSLHLLLLGGLGMRVQGAAGGDRGLSEDVLLVSDITAPERRCRVFFCFLFVARPAPSL